MSSADASLAASAAAAGGGRGGEAENGGALLRSRNGSVYMEDVAVVLIMPFGDAGSHRSPSGDGDDGFEAARVDAGVGRGRTNEAQEESVRVDGDEVIMAAERAVAAAAVAGDVPIVAICAIPPAGAIGETVAADVPKSCEGVEARRRRLRRFERQT